MFTAVVYQHPLTIEHRTRIVGLAADARLPEQTQRSSSGWEVETRFERDGDAVQAHCKLVVSSTRFEKDAFRDLKKLYAIANTATESAIYFGD